MLVKNLQQNIHNCQEITYSVSMSAYSPENFAEWLDDAFKKSSFKSLAELADKVGLSRATVSSYASARPQTVSNKPSRPKRENVIKIAEALNQEVNRALLITGHAPLSETKPIPKPIIEALAREGELDPNDEILIAEFITRLKQTQ